MISNSRKLSLLFLLGALLVAACDQAATPATEEEGVPVVVDDFNVIAEGRLTPRQHVQLAFNAGGLVAEVLVAEGDTAEAGQVLARLDNGEQLRSNVTQAELSVEQAELELLNAQLALDDLHENAALVAAEAQQAVARAEEQLDDAQDDLRYLLNPDVEYYEDQVDDAQEALTIAQQNQELAEINDALAGVEAAEDRLEDIEVILDRVKVEFERCPWCNPDDPDHYVNVDGVSWSMFDIMEAYNGGLNAVREAQLRLEQAQINNTNAIEAAEEDLQDAQEDLAWVQRDPDAIDLALRQADVTVAEAALADAQARWADVKDGPDPDELEAAEARLKQAEAQIASAEAALVAAEAALDDIELRAPWSGTVADLNIKVGENVSPGQTVVTLADFSAWMVETDNLTEIEVPDVSVGQTVSITPDALPDLELAGEVETIASLFEEKRGDVTYTVDIILTEDDPRLRWGMTVVATFDRRS